jgi:hypothetical protein
VRELGVVVVVGLMALLAIRLVRARPHWFVLVAGALAAYAGRRVGLETGFIKWVDHRVLERMDEQFDNVDSWLVSLAVVSAVLVSASRIERRRTS